MMNTTKKLATVAILGALALPASASLVTLGGGINQQFDQLLVSTEGDSTITQTYVPGAADTFVELGLTAVTGFKIGGSPTGFPNGYDLIFDTILNGTAVTTSAGGGLLDIDVTFDNTSFASLIHDDLQFGGLNGNLTTIANLSMASGGCTLQVDAANPTSTTNNGTCNVSFNFDAALATWFTTSTGQDFTTLANQPTIDFSLDIDITEYNFIPGAPVAGNITTIKVAHDGSAVINVPEPASVAILGLGLLGFAASRRKA